jgi:hypothetical protein
LKRRLLIFFGVTVASLILAYHTYLLQDGKIDWRHLLIWQLAWSYLWLAITPLIFYLASRYRSVLLHILFGEVITIAHSAAATAIAGVGFNHIYDLSAQRGIVVYALLVCLFYTLEYQRTYREKELENSKLQAEIAGAEFQVLKTTMNPEFVFQKLETIRNLMRKNPDEAETLIADLGDFLRSSLGS